MGPTRSHNQQTRVSGTERNGDNSPPLPGHKENNCAKYSEWLADFIRNVRKDVGAPHLPFVIGVMGVGGNSGDANASNLAFREAMAALPEFKGNVIVCALMWWCLSLR
ncbi:MAG: hypothetical protein WCP35_06790 [Verrucomicrobiota bacterium]